MLAVVTCFFHSLASEHPQAHFGAYGLKYYPTLDGYQQYVGQTVEYLPKKTPSYDDKQFERLYNGKYNTPYIIQKVSGNDKTVKLELVEKDNPKAKIKFEFKNYDEMYSYGKNVYANTEKYQVPLFFPDSFAAASADYVNKQIKAQGDTYLNIEKMIMEYPSDDEYPEPSYVIENTLTKDTFVTSIYEVSNYTQILGKVYSDPQCNFTLTVTDLKYKKDKYFTEEVYSLYNSATGETEKTTVKKGSYAYSNGKKPDEYAKSAFIEAKSGRYFATLSKVEKPSNSAIRYGKTTVVKDKDITKFSYVDNVIDILILPSFKNFSFELKNVSANSIKIIWDEAAFVDASGSTSKIMHVGTKYSERNSSQPATTVIKNAKIEDVATPTDRVYYSDLLKEWTSSTMYPTEPKLTGKQIQLMLPIQIKDVINEYIFVFDLNYSLNHPELLVSANE